MIFFKVNQNLYYRTEIDYIYFALPEIYLSNSLLSLDIIELKLITFILHYLKYIYPIHCYPLTSKWQQGTTNQRVDNNKIASNCNQVCD